MRMKKLVNVALVALAWIPQVTAAPSGFEDRTVLSGQSFTIDFAFLPTGELLTVQKEGIVNVFEDPKGDFSYSKQTRALDLRSIMCDNSERGMSGIAVHPDFGKKNRYIYLYYTFNKHGTCKEDAKVGPCNRLSRFELSESNKIDKNSEKVFFDTPELAFRFHNAGKIEFGKDGYLYVTVGEGGMRAESQNPGSILGSVVRLTDDGGIPEDNPFRGSDSVRCNKNGVPPTGSPSNAKCQEVCAIGLRNPFRFGMNPNTKGDKVHYYINDVGASTWEEIHEGGDDFRGSKYGELGVPNYGYPRREGPCRHSRTSDCANQEGYVTPIHYYVHDNGGAATAGAFVPNGLWPKKYDDGYLYADFVFGNIYLMKDSGKKECLSCDPPKSNKDISVFTSFESIVTMRFGPYKDTQALYYASTAEGGVVRRVTYVGDGNRTPDAVIKASSTSVNPGDKVEFDGRKSSDQDNDRLKYEWDFDGDGKIDATDSKDSYVYKKPGVYRAKLTVRDGNGAKGTASVKISVGISPPKPIILSPSEGEKFHVGEVFTVKGRATDPDDGELDDSSLTWEVRQHHDQHYHPFLVPTTGNNIQLLPSPQPEDYYAATNSYLEILLTATNSHGIQETVSRKVMPKKVLMDFDSEPSGLEIFLDGTRIKTPATVTSWEDHKLLVETPDQKLKGKSQRFVSWSNGGSQTQLVTVPPVSTKSRQKLVARFEEGGSAKCRQPGALIVSDQTLLADQTIVNSRFNVYLRQQADGNLVLRSGTPDNPGKVLWSSGAVSGESRAYYTRLQRDGNLLIRKGSPSDSTRGATVWKTDTPGDDMDYFLGVNCDGETLAVYRGTPGNAGKVIWSSALTGGTTCKPTALLRSGQTIKPDQAILRGKFFIKQQRDGNLLVRKGTPDNRGEVVWSSGFHKDGTADYYTRMQGDAHLITRKGKEGTAVWKSNTSFGSDKDYFLGVDCDGKKVSIYQGNADNPGKVMYTFDDKSNLASASCKPAVLMSSDQTLKVDQVRETKDGEAYIVQQGDGNLVVWEGTPEKKGDVIWKSNVVSTSSKEYMTRFQGDGQLMTRKGNLRVWKSNTSFDDSKVYVLAVRCDGKSVAIYEGTRDNPYQELKVL